MQLLVVASILLVLVSSSNAVRFPRDVEYSVSRREPRVVRNLEGRQSINSNCEEAIQLTFDAEPITVDTSASNFYFLESPAVIDVVTFKSVATPNGAGLWYEFTGTGQSVQVSTCNDAPSSSKITVNVFKVGNDNCSDISSPVAGTSYQSGGKCEGGNPTVTLCTELNAIYKVYVAGSRVGDPFTVSVKENGVCSKPQNSDITKAIEISLNKAGSASINGNNFGAPIQLIPCCNPQGVCFTGFTSAAATFYKIKGTNSAINVEVVVDESSSLDFTMSVYSSHKNGQLSCVVGEDDDIFSQEYQPKVSFVGVKDVEYVIAVYTYEGSNGGDFTLEIESTSFIEPENEIPKVENVKLEKTEDSNEIVISYDLQDDDQSNGVHFYVLISKEWILINSGLSGDIGASVNVDGKRKTFSWNGGLSGKYYIQIKANDNEYQSSSEPLFIHVNREVNQEEDDYTHNQLPYIPYHKVITWVNERAGAQVVFTEQPTETKN